MTNNHIMLWSISVFAHAVIQEEMVKFCKTGPTKRLTTKERQEFIKLSQITWVMVAQMHLERKSIEHI